MGKQVIWRNEAALRSWCRIGFDSACSDGDGCRVLRVTRSSHGARSGFARNRARRISSQVERPRARSGVDQQRRLASGFGLARCCQDVVARCCPGWRTHVGAWRGATWAARFCARKLPGQRPGNNAATCAGFRSRPGPGKGTWLCKGRCSARWPYGDQGCFRRRPRTLYGRASQPNHAASSARCAVVAPAPRDRGPNAHRLGRTAGGHRPALHHPSAGFGGGDRAHWARYFQLSQQSCRQRR